MNYYEFLIVHKVTKPEHEQLVKVLAMHRFDKAMALKYPRKGKTGPRTKKAA
ncbi:MAG: hypothetical protein WC829_07005 [Hyphomicrobium sp.]|jgi:hypothetical protein